MSLSRPGVSVLAAIVSLFAMLSTMYTAMIDIKIESMPTLSIRQDQEDNWHIENIGVGPAIDPVVTYQVRGKAGWLRAQRLYPMKAGELVIARKVPSDPIGIRVRYRDIYGNEYVSTLAAGRLDIQTQLPFLLRMI